MNKLERVARAICKVRGDYPDDEWYGKNAQWWEAFTSEAQAAIDAMSVCIAEVDRKAREECAEICANVEDRQLRVDCARTARECWAEIRETIK